MSADPISSPNQGPRDIYGKKARAETDALLSEVAEHSLQQSNYATHRVGPMETHTDAADRLAARLDMAYAMSYMITGEGHSHFSGANDRIQNDYLWCISQLIAAAKVDAAIVVANHGGTEQAP